MGKEDYARGYLDGEAAVIKRLRAFVAEGRYPLESGVALEDCFLSIELSAMRTRQHMTPVSQAAFDEARAWIAELRDERTKGAGG